MAVKQESFPLSHYKAAKAKRGKKGREGESQTGDPDITKTGRPSVKRAALAGCLWTKPPSSNTATGKNKDSAWHPYSQCLPHYSH